MECYGCLRNVQDLLADGKTLYQRRFGEPLKGPTIPFEAMVEYHPNSARDQARILYLARKSYLGSFLAVSWSREEFGKEMF